MLHILKDALFDCSKCSEAGESNAESLVIDIYLLTAIGLSPGGSTHLQTNNT